MIKPKMNKSDRLHAYEHGIYAKLDDDVDWTHYRVLDIDSNFMLVCFGKVSWRDGEIRYTPHVLSISDRGKTWFLRREDICQSR